MKITAAASVVPVTNLDASIQFYTESLGFKQEFRYGKYAGLERGNCLLHLSQHANLNSGKPGSATVYVFCDDADSIYNEVIGRGVTVTSEPQDYPYGMRDFEAFDLDGNRFVFGSPTKEA